MKFVSSLENIYNGPEQITNNDNDKSFVSSSENIYCGPEQ
jgi:hypothetical protein